MKTLHAVLAVGLVLGSATGATSLASPMAKAAIDVCLKASDIDHSSVVSDTVILFYLKTGKVLKTTLRATCPGLRFEHAFTEDIQGGEICSNRQAIRVVHRDIPCYLGTFGPYEGAAARN